MLSPLQLERYAFTKVSVSALNDGSLANGGKIHHKLQHLKDEDKPNRWILNLQFRSEPVSPEKISAYLVDVVVEGVVRVAETVPASERERMALVNGFSLLYGSIREMIMTITSRSPHGPLLIPSVNFQKMVKLSDQSEQQTESPATETTVSKS